MFNALRYTKKLEEVGFTREQAETHIEIMTEIIDTSLATKQDMKDLTVVFRQEMKDLSVSLRQEMKEVKIELRGEMAQLENRMVIKLGAISSVGIGVAVALTQLIS